MHIKQMAEEKPSKLFLSMEKQRTKNNILNFLKDENGNYYNDSISMCKYANPFYTDLYSTEHIESKAIKDILNTVKNDIFPDSVIDNLENSINPNHLDNKGSCWILKDVYCSLTMHRKLGLMKLKLFKPLIKWILVHPQV